MKTIKRTSKVISVENLSENAIRKIASLGGLESHCINMDWGRFKVKNEFIGQVGGDDLHDGVRIEIKGFDTDIRVWDKTGQVQGYYNSGSGNAQYAANYIEWSNFMLSEGFFEIV